MKPYHLYFLLQVAEGVVVVVTTAEVAAVEVMEVAVGVESKEAGKTRAPRASAQNGIRVGVATVGRGAGEGGIRLGVAIRGEGGIKEVAIKVAVATRGEAATRVAVVVIRVEVVVIRVGAATKEVVTRVGVGVVIRVGVIKGVASVVGAGGGGVREGAGVEVDDYLLASYILDTDDS